MRKLAALMLSAILLLGLACAWAETAADLVGCWTMDYFGFPMYFAFSENGTYDAMIDVDFEFDEGNYFTGTWAFDGKTLIVHGDEGDQSFTWDGEKLTGVILDTEVVMERAVSPAATAAN